MTIRELGNAILDMPYGGTSLVLVFIGLGVVLPIIGAIIRAQYRRRFDR